MRNLIKFLADNMTGPFTAILTSRCEIVKDYKNNTFYLYHNHVGDSWGVRFEMKKGYTSKINGTKLGISHGTINGKLSWVSVMTRPLTLDYTFSVYKDGELYDTYRVVSFT